MIVLGFLMLVGVFVHSNQACKVAVIKCQMALMKKILPHIEIGYDQYGAVALSVEDYELFDFISDYVTEQCDLDWEDKTHKENEQGEVHIMYFSQKHSIKDVEGALLKLSPTEINDVYALNN
ncbi:hypothetical protein [Agarivorans sp. Alg241-V36]|uniref:hypothetical protein n=1 Tax=Agarivorans sp. Alg241-V36 TaxID=2305992 RepID=UPI0013D452A1|nr:hypothetical protein [Agarivorans sp. Alg241-V36]